MHVSEHKLGFFYLFTPTMGGYVDGFPKRLLWTYSMR